MNHPKKPAIAAVKEMVNFNYFSGPQKAYVKIRKHKAVEGVSKGKETKRPWKEMTTSSNEGMQGKQHDVPYN